jgi:hypothetical protein
VKAQIEIGIRDTNGGEQSLIKTTLDVSGKAGLNLRETLYGFINAVLKSDSVMNVFELKPIDREYVLWPSASIKEDCEIDISVAKKGLQKSVKRTADQDVLSEKIDLHLRVKFE